MAGKIMVRVVKIGGNIIDQPEKMTAFLPQFAALSGAKILVHGGGVLANQMALQLGISQTMIEGRRITDLDTLRIAVMVYGGWINKQLVAKLYAVGCPAIGVCGADGDVIRAVKRPVKKVDFGWAGDVTSVNTEQLHGWLAKGLAPVMSPITHDGRGQLLNTNADTIAQEVAKSLSKAFHVELIYGFDQAGVLADTPEGRQVMPVLRRSDFQQLKATGQINGGMIPKLDNAFSALSSGVKGIRIGPAESLTQLIAGTAGTAIEW
jgi:acetylglutamate kinase